MLSKIALISQLLIAILAILRYRKFKTRFVLLLCYLLVIIVFIEGYGFYQITFDTGRRTINLLNFYTYLEFILIVLMYKSIIKSKWHIKVINIIAVTFMIVYSSSFFIPNVNPFDLIPIEALLISVIVIIYLAELLQSDKIIDYKKHLPFWVSVGFFIFYLSSIPFFSMYKYMVKRNLFYILSLLIILMNIFIGIGLLCSNTKEKY